MRARANWRRRRSLLVEHLEQRVTLSITIMPDFTYDSLGFFTQYPQAKADVLLAAADISAHLNDTLSAIVPSNGNTWEEDIFDPSNTSSNIAIQNPTVPANTIVIYVGGSHLSAGELGLGGPAGYSYSGPNSWGDIIKGRGQPGALLSSPTDTSPFGGSASFTFDNPWDFTPGTLDTVGGDFFSTALHEMTHVLGIGTADSWYTDVDSTNHLFSGARAEAAYGGKVPTDAGSQDGHWATGTATNGQVALMDPYGGAGVYTELDWAGLGDIGWQDESLVVKTQPPQIVPVGGAFGLSVATEYEDGYVDTTYNGPITVSLGNNSNGATLGGSTTAMAVNGVAQFSNLTVNQSGSGYTLVASDSASPSVTSQAFAAQSNTTVTLSAQPTHSVYGQVINLTSTVTDSVVGSSTPTGSVTFMDGLATLGSAPLNGNGVASLPISNLVAGPYAITAVYSGDALTSPATSPTIQITVAPDSTLTKFSLTPNSTTYSQSVTLSATVSVVAPGVGLPTGSVGFYDGSTYIGSGTLDQTGKAVFSIASLLPGVHSLSAHYLGDLNDATSSSTNATLTVGADASSVVFTASPSPVVTGQAETLTATVRSGSGRTPTGSVTFTDEAGTLGTASLSGGIARFTSGTLPVGTHKITATYSGDTIASPAVSLSSSLSVTAAMTTTTITIPTSVSFGRALNIVAQIAVVAPGITKPSGSISFYDGGTLLGSSKISVTGQAILTTSSLKLGTHSILSIYSGDATDLSSQSYVSSLYVGDGVKGDFDGDGKADLAVFGKDPLTGRYDFRIHTSSSQFKTTVTYDNNGYGFGNASSIPVPADYFGDGRSAYALWTPNSLGGMTFTAVSSVTNQVISFNFGGTKDIPVVADVDGDGKADFGVFGYQPGLGYRFDFLLSSKGFNPTSQYVFNNNGYGYGNANSIPVVADFDGNGHADLGLFSPSIFGSTFSYVDAVTQYGFTSKVVGTPNDIPMAVDIDGDGKADFELYGPAPNQTNHYRYLILTAASGFSTSNLITFDNNGYGYGNSGSIPVIADYDGTGKADFGVFTPDYRGGMEFVYQTSQPGLGLGDFATLTDLPLTAPTYFLAKKVRGS